MVEVIACCGLACHSCPIYLATRQEDKGAQREMRLEIIRMCKEQYGLNLKLEDITDCDGCNSRSERLFSQCRSCVISECAKSSGMEYCSYCSEYPCEKLLPLFKSDPEAQKRLEQIRNCN